MAKVRSDEAESIKINFSDLAEYAKTTDGQNPSSVTKLLCLNSQFQVDGLMALRSAVNSAEPKTPEQLQNDCAVKLLEDLEKFSKREDFIKGWDLPERKFEMSELNEEFFKKAKEEIVKPREQWSPTLQNFVDYCASRQDKDVVEKISAQMLNNLGENKTSESIKTELNSSLGEYQGTLSKQVIADLDERNIILLKDKDGKTRSIDFADLDKEPLTKQLTGEQREFIKSAWHQGTFSGGWISDKYPMDKAPEQNKLFSGVKDMDPILIDLSQEGKTLVYNRAKLNSVPADNPEGQPIPYLEGTLAVDISALKGDKYIPGCASAQPKIEATISVLDKELGYDLPESLKTTPGNSQVHANLKQDTAQGYLDEVLKGGKKSGTATTFLTAQMGEEKTKQFIEDGCLNEILQRGKNTSKSFKYLLDNLGEEKAKKMIVDRVLDSDLPPNQKLEALNNLSTLVDPRVQQDRSKPPVILGAKFFADTIKEKMVDKIAEHLQNRGDKEELVIDPSKLGIPKWAYQKQELQIPSIIMNLALQVPSQQGERNQRIAKTAVEFYVQIEPDKQKQEQYAAKQLDKYLHGQTNPVLDTKEKERIKEGVISILEPLCGNDEEAKKALRENAGKLVRRCAEEAGAKMSFSQSWQSFKDKVGLNVSKLFHKTSKLEEILNKNPNVKKVLKDTFYPPRENANIRSTHKSEKGAGRGGRD